MQRTNTSKVEYAIEMKFLSGKWVYGVKIRVNLLTLTARRQATGLHVLDSMWTTSQARAVALNSPWPLPVGRRRPIRRQCLKSLICDKGDQAQCKDNIKRSLVLSLYNNNLKNIFRIVIHVEISSQQRAVSLVTSRSHDI